MILLAATPKTGPMADADAEEVRPAVGKMTSHPNHETRAAPNLVQAAEVGQIPPPRVMTPDLAQAKAARGAEVADEIVRVRRVLEEGETEIITATETSNQQKSPRRTTGLALELISTPTMHLQKILTARARVGSVDDAAVHAIKAVRTTDAVVRNQTSDQRLRLRLVAGLVPDFSMTT